MKLDIRLVAHAHIVGKPFLAFQPGLGDQGQGHIAALGEQGDITFGDIPHSYQVQAHLQVHHAGRVGADQSNAMLAGRCHHLVFKLAALGAGFSETARQDYSTRHPLLAAIVEDGRYGPGRYGNQGKVYKPFYLGNGFVTFEAQDRGFLGIHRVDLPLILFLQQGADGLITPFGLVFRGSHNGNGFGIQYFFKHGFCSAESYKLVVIS